MTSREHIPLRADHSRTASTTESPGASTASSASIAPGPGALGAKFLKWVGDTGLDSIQDLVIRRRLVAIKQVVRNKPHMFSDAQSSREVHEADRIYEDLRELCTGRGNYSLSIRRSAARMILEIAFLMHAKEGTNALALSDWVTAVEDPWNRWSALMKLSKMRAIHLDSKALVNDDSLMTSMDAGLSSVATSNTDNTVDSQSTIRLMDDGTWADVAIRRKLTLIKRTVRKRPHIFTCAQAPDQMQEVDDVFIYLARMNRHHSSRIRKRAARLVLEIAVMISGPRETLLSQNTIEGNETAAVGARQVWDDLVASTDVQSLLTIPPATPSFMSRLLKSRS